MKILNLSITTGIFPNSFKKAKITPCFKKGDKSDMSNYRPISVLPLLSKLLERHVADNLKSYLMNMICCMSSSPDSEPIIHVRLLLLP